MRVVIASVNQVVLLNRKKPTGLDVSWKRWPVKSEVFALQRIAVRKIQSVTFQQKIPMFKLQNLDGKVMKGKVKSFNFIVLISFTKSAMMNSIFSGYYYKQELLPTDLNKKDIVIDQRITRNHIREALVQRAGEATPTWIDVNRFLLQK